MSLENINLISEISKELKLGINRQRELINFFTELSLKEEISVKEILANDKLQQFLNNPKITRDQKIKKLWDFLKKRRYPIIYQVEQNFQKLKKQLKLPREIILNHSPFFEKDELEIKFQFRNKEELEKIAKKLLELSKNEKIEKFLNRLTENSILIVNKGL